MAELDVERLAEGLRVLADTQRDVGSVEPAWVTDVNPEYVRTTFLALIVELSELLQEFNWKPWKAPREVNLDRMVDEFADVLAFLGYIIMWLGYMGADTGDLARGYRRKTAINYQRLSGKISGYGFASSDTAEE